MDKIKHIIADINKIIQNPFGLLEKGIFDTFIPKYPEIIVGIDKISVTTVKSCITLFWLLLIMALNASMILLSISP